MATGSLKMASFNPVVQKQTSLLNKRDFYAILE